MTALASTPLRAQRSWTRSASSWQDEVRWIFDDPGHARMTVASFTVANFPEIAALIGATDDQHLRRTISGHAREALPRGPEPSDIREERALRCAACAYFYLPGYEVSSRTYLEYEQGALARGESVARQAAVRARLSWARQIHVHELSSAGKATPLPAFGPSEASEKTARRYKADYAEAFIRLIEQLADDDYGDDDQDSTDAPSLPLHVEPDELAIRTLLADRLDAPSPIYPRHLTPSVLSRSLAVLPASGTSSPEDMDSLARLIADSRRGVQASALEEVAKYRRVILLGDPGGGKSTLLAARCVDRLRDGQGAAISVRAAALALALRDRLVSSVADAIDLIVETAAADLRLDPAVFDASFRRLLAEHPASVIALDGLDEVSAKGQALDEFFRVLDGIPGQLIRSSRLAGYENAPSKDWVELTVAPLDRESRVSFVESWFDSGDNPAGRERALRAVQDAAHGEIAGIPVLLGIIAKIAERDAVPTTSSALYDRYLQRYFAGDWRGRSRAPRDVRALRDAAEKIAWGMATGFDPSSRIDGRSWIDQATRDELYSVVDSDRAAIDEIIDADGLLVRHGDYDEPLSQQYRWIHRTIQEHLVGMHLASMLRTRREPALELVLAMVQTFRGWQVPLEHFLTALQPMQQEVVLAHLIAVRDEGDPAGVIQKTLERLAPVLRFDSPARAQIVEGAWGRGAWRTAFHLSPEATRAALIAAAEEGRPELDEHDDDFVRLAALVGRDTWAQVVRNSLAAHRTIDNPRSQTAILEAFSRIDSVAALDAYAEALHAGVWYWPRFLIEHDDVPDDDAARLVNRVVEFPTPTGRVLWLRAVTALGVDTKALLAADDLDDEEAQVALWVGVRRRGGHGDWFEAEEPSTSAADRAQRGAFGPYTAFEHARMVGIHATNPCAAAEIGALLRVLVDSPSTVAVDGEAPARVQTGTDQGLEDIDRLLQVLREVAGDAGDTRLPRLIELYRQLLVWQETNTNGHWLMSRGEPAIPMAAVAHDVMVAAQAYPKPEILRLLKQSEAAVWPARTVSDLVYYLVIDTEAEHGRADSAYDALVRWSCELALPILIGPVPPRDVLDLGRVDQV